MPLVSSPVRVSLAAPPVVRAGVRAILTPHSDRVTVLARQSLDRAEVEVFVPVGDPDAAALAARTATVPMVALTDRRDTGATALAVSLGAARVLHLDVDAIELVTTLEEVRSGAPLPAEGAHTALSGRESEILDRICRGLSNDEIACDLYLSINSVKTYVRSAYRKMGVQRRSQAVLWGLEHGYGDELPR
ncbi:MAG: helix-turn-helix transcriptional regulator [Nocardioides sp.]|nr:helix-turn-helix transcriptional regulator [Nocardioides sp.]